MKAEKTLVLLCFIIALICRPVLADIVRLKDGRSIEGEIVEEDDQIIKIKLNVARGVGYVPVRKEDVRRIVRERPEERERRVDETMRAKGLVKDGDEWVTEEVKAARDAQRKAEQERKMEERAVFQRQIQELKQEQRELQETQEAARERLQRSTRENTAILRDTVLKVAFFAVLAAVAFTLLKRYFWD